MNDREVEERLEAAGRAWRQGQPAPPVPDLQSAARRPGRLRLPVAAGIVVAIGAVLLALGVPWRWAAVGTAVPATPAAMAPSSVVPGVGWPVVRVGDRVTAGGSIVIDGDGFVLCRPGIVEDRAYQPGQEPPPRCDWMRVRVVGPVDGLVPEWFERAGIRFSPPVRVSGTWMGDSLSVTDLASPAQGGPPTPFRLHLPEACVAAADSWGFDDFASPPEAEAALAALADELRRRPTTYAGSWRAYRGSPASAEQAAGRPSGIIVATVDDAAVVGPALAAIYSGNLCVVTVDHSTAELEAIVADLRTRHPVGLVEIDAPRNGVRIDLPIIDVTAVAAIDQVRVPVSLEPWITRE